MKNTKLLLFSFFVFYSSFSIAQNGWLWGTGGKGLAQISSLSTDINGDCMAFGLHYGDTIHFGSYSFLDSTNNLGFFLVKLSPNGNILWAEQAMNKAANPLPDFNNGMNTDMTGNSYCVGSFSDTIIFGSTTLFNNKFYINGSITSFVTKYDPNGNIKWALQFFLINDSSGISASGVSTDTKGNCFVAGGFYDSVSIGGQVLYTQTSRDINTYLVKYDSNGNFKWVRQSLGNASAAGPGPVTTDRYGNSIITGDFSGTLEFGADTLRAQNGGCTFTTKYDSNGNVLWTREGSCLANGSNDGTRAITDLTGNVYVLGYFSHIAVFAPDTLSTSSFESIFLVKYNPNGDIIWAKQTDILDANQWFADGLAIDKNNHIYFSCDGGGAGSSLYEIKFGDTTLDLIDTSFYVYALCTFKLDSNGNVLCSNILPGAGNLDWSGLASDSSGNFVYVGGNTVSPLVFGSDTFSANPTTTSFSSFIARWQECDANLITAISSNKKSYEQVNLFPNPNNGIFTIALNHPELFSESQIVVIYNILGEKIYAAPLKPVRTVQPGGQVQNDNTINLTGQPDGVYFYRLVSQAGEMIGEGKIIIEK